MTATLAPPFMSASAVAKVRAGENLWNTRDPERVALGYTPDSWWRNRSSFLQGRDQIVQFLTTESGNPNSTTDSLRSSGHSPQSNIAVRFAYEHHDATGHWFRAYGNENWEFDADGLMKIRHASINDVAITEDQRLFRWDSSGSRPDDHPGLSDLGL